MSLSSAMNVGVSGLNINAEAITVVGNNIANVNTVGFKEGRTLFSDVLSQNMGAGQVGRGAKIQSIDNIFSQSSFETTTRDLDLAIQGDSFFTLQSPNSADKFYSRAGAFSLDNNKQLVNADGYKVLGFGIDPATQLSNGTLDAIDLTNFATLNPVATSTLDLGLNLNANAATGDTFSTSLNVYDSQGIAHNNIFVFTKNAVANTWGLTSTANGATSAAITGTLTFNPDGSLNTATPAGAQAITFAGGVAANAVTFNFLPAAVTQYASPSVVSTQTQNGYAPGNLEKLTVDENGYLNGQYSNGLFQKIAQIGLAKFPATSGLIKVGGTMFQETLASGQPQIANASITGFGQVFSNSLEQSNVDMAAQLVSMIKLQRAYSGNSKTITTSDEMMQETLSLKR